MPFPQVERVIYQPNSLDSVICQLRFPTILQIDQQPPATLQNRIREFYPIFKENIEAVHEINIQQPNMELNSQVINKSTFIKNYQFSTFEEDYKINLTNSFIALTTTKYKRWEDFSDKLDFVCKYFIDEYKPPFFTRIGLRYVNIIEREKYGLEDCSWRDLIDPKYLGFLGEEYSERIKSYHSAYDIPLSEDKCGVKVVTTIGRREPNEDANKVFVIDSDFYCQKRTLTNEYLSQLSFLNSRSSRLIRMMVTEKLHKAMNPIPVEGGNKIV